MADKNPAAMHVAIMAYASERGVFPAGTRLRADDPAVKSHPAYWIAEDTSDAERQAAYVMRFPGVPPIR